MYVFTISCPLILVFGYMDYCERLLRHGALCVRSRVSVNDIFVLHILNVAQLTVTYGRDVCFR